MRTRATWPELTLGELLRVKHGFAFKGEHFEPDGEQLVLTPGNFRIGGGMQLRANKERFYAAAYPAEFTLEPGDLLIAMTDLTQSSPILGSPMVVPADRTYLHNQRLGKVVMLDPERLDRDFAYFLFASDAVRGQLRGSATGSTVRHTAPRRIYAARIRLPPLPVQRKIAAILSAYDDLVENNNRRITLLEEMAQRSYSEWFVDFRYPGHEDVPLVESELGPIPEVWTIAPLAALATITMGQSPPSSAYNRDGVGLPFHQGVGTYGVHFPVHKVCSTDGARLADAGDILLSIRAPVGRINLADRQMILGRGLAGLRATGAPREFLLHALKRFFREEDILGSGAIFQSVTKRDVQGLRLVWPGDTLAARFTAIAKPIWEQLHLLTVESANLRATRDLLLPRLISGEIDVEDPDIVVPEPAA